MTVIIRKGSVKSKSKYCNRNNIKGIQVSSCAPKQKRSKLDRALGGAVCLKGEAKQEDQSVFGNKVVTPAQISKANKAIKAVTFKPENTARKSMDGSIVTRRKDCRSVGESCVTVRFRQKTTRG